MKIHQAADLYQISRSKPSPAPGKGAAAAVAGAVRTATDFLDEHPLVGAAVSNTFALNRGVQTFPQFIYPTLFQATEGERRQIYDVLDSLPLADVNSAKSISVVPEIPSTKPGWVTRGLATDVNFSNYIQLSRTELQNPAEFRKVLIHETAHTRDFESAWFGLFGEHSSKKPFGEGPYISDYAKTNHFEDYAETYANYHVNPERTRQEVPEKFAEMQKLEEPSPLERLIDRKEFRETGRWLGENMASNRATRNAVQAFSYLSGGVQAVQGLDQLRKSTQGGDPGQHYRGIMNLAAGVLFSTGLLAIPGMAVHGAQRALNRAVERGEFSTLDADAAVRTLSDPVERTARKFGSELGLTAPFRSLEDQFPQAHPKAGLALGVAAGGAVGGLAGTLAGPYAGVLAGFQLAGPVGGSVGLVLGALGGYALGTELGGRAGGALARALGA